LYDPCIERKPQQTFNRPIETEEQRNLDPLQGERLVVVEFQKKRPASQNPGEGFVLGVVVGPVEQVVAEPEVGLAQAVVGPEAVVVAVVEPEVGQVVAVVELVVVQVVAVVEPEVVQVVAAEVVQVVSVAVET
jgi:hypothetical protein